MPLPPLQIHMTLSPWFTRKTLDQAINIAARPDMARVFFYRSAAAAVFPHDYAWCSVSFEKTSKIRQQFRIAAVTCSRCGFAQKIGDYCGHAAVAAVGMLQDHPAFGIAVLPLTFQQSLWYHVGRFLAEQPSSQPLAPATVQNTHGTLTKDGTSVSFLMDPRLEAEGAARFQNIFPGAQDQGNNAALYRSAQEAMQRFTVTETETQLNRIGQTSKGQLTDSSIWMWLCRRFSQTAFDCRWHLERREQDMLFSLRALHDQKMVLEITPRRQASYELLHHFAAIGLIAAAPAARAYRKFFFTANHHDLEIEPWLELADGRRLPRSDLEKQRYGSRYSLNGRDFFSVLEQNYDISPKDTSGGLPLLAFAQRTANTSNYQRIPARDVPAFLEKHRDHIFSPQNETCERLRHFSLQELPDRIAIHDYREDEDWCYLAATYGIGDRNFTGKELREMAQQGARTVPTSGKWLNLTESPFAWIFGLEKKKHHSGGKKSAGMLRLTRQELMALASLVPELRFPKQESVAAILKKRLSQDSEELSGQDMPAHLRTYQKIGVAWLYHLYSNGVGAVLADDMGLGKTHQALVMAELLVKRGDLPILVICPASVLPHWENKIGSFFPGLAYSVYYGAARHQLDLGAARILLTTYGIVRQDIDALAALSFSLVIFDEVQQLRNKRTAISRAARRLQRKAAFGLTGTPLENSLSDLKSIFDLCLPGLLGSDDSFTRIYQQPIESDRDTERGNALKKLLQPFMLRRLRRQVLTELPDVIEDNRTCLLSQDQLTLYRAVIESRGKEVLERLTPDSRQFPYLDILSVIHRLKQVCNHPCLVEKNTDYQKYQSGKWNLFCEILDECLAASMKVVVFSQYLSMLDVIEKYLQDQGIVFAGLRGGMPVYKRQEMIVRFNSDPRVMVFTASLLAAGVGIDLTAAQVVIHFDRWWNPAREDQATARVHRMGQRHTVQVFKFITTGSLEEKIHQIIMTKKNLSEEIIEADDASLVKRLSREELISLLQM